MLLSEADVVVFGEHTCRRLNLFSLNPGDVGDLVENIFLATFNEFVPIVDVFGHELLVIEHFFNDYVEHAQC